MNKHILLAFIIAVALGSCENNRVPDCSSCVSDKNGDAKLLVSLSIPDGLTNPVIINVYGGVLEDNDLLLSLSTNYEYMELPVIADKDYTVTATYIIGDKEYIAVDSARPTVIYDDSSCDIPCYYVTGNKINLKLKYYK